MKTRLEQAKRSGVTLIEILAGVVVLLILSASIQKVSDGRGAPKPPPPDNVVTNQAPRDVHAPVEVFHTYEASR